MKDTEIPDIHNRIELAEWLKPLYVIEPYTVDHKTYASFRTSVYNILRGCYPIKACRDFPVRFKLYLNDDAVYTLPLRMFVLNSILWIPFVELYGTQTLDETSILSDPEKVPEITEWINENLIGVLNEYHVATVKKNQAISDVLYFLRQISIDYSLILGINFSAMTFMSLYNNNDTVRGLMEPEFEDWWQPAEIESKLDEMQRAYIDTVSAIPGNHLGLVLRSGTGIKHKQLREFVIAQGLKPDLTGKTIPILNKNSTMIGGASTPSALYIEAMGSRKSLIMNKKVMGLAGIFGKKLLMTARTLSLSTEINDCGSTHLVGYDVVNKKVLKKLVGKYYQLDKNDLDEPLKLLSKKDTHLIGRTIYVRSAATCCCGDTVCPVCVGTAAVTNADLADGLSGFESEEVTKHVNQGVLSAKHLLTTNSEEIKFNAEFYDFFNMVEGVVYMKENPSVNTDDLAIYVNPADISKVDEQDQDTTYNVVIANGRFYIRNLRDPSVADILIQAEGKEIYIDTEMYARLTSHRYMVPFSTLESENNLFEVVIMNRELTKPLYDMMSLLDKQSKDGDMTIDFISNQFVKYCIDGGVSASAIACELIINRLIRSADNIYRRPDFSKPVLEPYVIITASQSLLKSPSPLVGISFQNLPKQILDPDFFTKRTAPSYADPYFDEDVSTEQWEDYTAYAEKLYQD